MHIALFITGHCDCVHECLVPKINTFLSTRPNVYIDVYMSLCQPLQTELVFDTDRANVVMLATGWYVTPSHLESQSADASNILIPFYFNHHVCEAIKRSSITYDCVVKFRHDIEQATSLPDAIETTQCQENVIYVPDTLYEGGVNSDIAWGTVSSMCKYGRVYEHVMAEPGTLPCTFKSQTILNHYCTTSEGLTFTTVPGYTYTVSSTMQ